MASGFPRDRKRRLLFNWDGSDVLAMIGNDPRPEVYLKHVFDCIDGSQVDMLLYNFGSGNVAEYESDVLEWPGEADAFQFTDDDSRWRYENARKLAEQGANPPAIISRACRDRELEVFVSMRMNDTHDTWMTSERPSFKREHPEWLLPQVRDCFANQQAVPGHMATSLNYAVDEVRELKLAVIREYLEKWDYDGIELDWSRHNSHFIPGTEYDSRHFLTDFTRQVRAITSAAEKRWGHPVLIFARVPETYHGCTVGGYDVAAWAKEEIVDGLVLGDMVVSVPYMRQFRDVMGDNHLPLYPSIYGYGMGYPLWDDSTLRGIAAGMWAAGADGLATYNLYPKGEFRRAVLQQIGDPRTLEGRDKRYVSPLNQLLAYTRFSRQNCPASALPAFLNLNPVDQSSTYIPHTIWAPLEVADDVAVAAANGRIDRIELFVGIEDVQPEDRVFISLNGYSLTEEWDDCIASHIEAIAWDLNAEDVEGSQPAASLEGTHLEYSGLRFEPPADWLRKGTNIVQVLLLPTVLRSREKQNELPPIFVTRVELFTGFGRS